MDVEALRKQVQQYIDTADEKTLKIIKAIFEIENSNVLKEDYPEYVRESIKIGIQELNDGKGIPHDEVMRSLDEEYPESVQLDIIEGKRQLANGESKTHAEVMKKYGRNHLPKALEESIRIGLRELDEGKGIPHDEVMRSLDDDEA